MCVRFRRPYIVRTVAIEKAGSPAAHTLNLEVHASVQFIVHNLNICSFSKVKLILSLPQSHLRAAKPLRPVQRAHPSTFFLYKFINLILIN